MPEVQAIIFDLGGTLWHWPRKNPTRDGAWFWDRSYDHALQMLSHPTELALAGRKAFADAMVAAETAYRRRARSEGRSQAPRGIVSDGLRRLGVRSDGAETPAVIDGYGRVAPGWVEPFPGAAPTLSRLRDSGYRLGLLSNTWWSSRWLDEDLKNLGLADFFDAVLYNSDLPRAKPHPSVFLKAARRLDAAPTACVMIGDDPRCDVAGAQDAGLRTVWNRDGRTDAEPGDVAPNATVESLSELPALLRSWRPWRARAMATRPGGNFFGRGFSKVR